MVVLDLKEEESYNPDRTMAGSERGMSSGDPIPPQRTPTEQHKPQQGRAEGRRSFQGPTTVEGSEPPQLSGLPSTPQERPTLPLKSALNRAVERTRDPYERDGWVFLPLGEVWKGSPGVSTLQGEQQPQSGGINKPEVLPPKESPLPFEPNLPSEERRRSNTSAMELVILTMLQEYSEMLGRLPHPLAPEMEEESWKLSIKEEMSKLYPDQQRWEEELDSQIDEALEDPIQRKKLLEDD